MMLTEAKRLQSNRCSTYGQTDLTLLADCNPTAWAHGSVLGGLLVHGLAVWRRIQEQFIGNIPKYDLPRTIPT